MRCLALLCLLAAVPVHAQIVDADTLYTSGSLSFDYQRTPFPTYGGSFLAEGDGLLPDGTMPPGVAACAGGGSGAAELDTVGTVVYGVVANDDGTFDGALVSLKTIGPLTAGNYGVNVTDGTAIFGYVDDAVEFVVPDTLDTETALQWLQDLQAAHKLISTSGSIQIHEVTADTLRGTFSGVAIDMDNLLFVVEFSQGAFALSGVDPATAAPGRVPMLATPTVRAHPNPFNPSTMVTIDLPEPQLILVAVHDIAGRHVRTLFEGMPGVEAMRLDWDGTDRDGRRAPAGVYMIRVSGVLGSDTVKVVLVP